MSKKTTGVFNHISEGVDSMWNSKFIQDVGVGSFLGGAGYGSYGTLTDYDNKGDYMDDGFLYGMGAAAVASPLGRKSGLLSKVKDGNSLLK